LFFPSAQSFDLARLKTCVSPSPTPIPRRKATGQEVELEFKPESKLRHGSTLALNAADPTSRWLSSMRLDTEPQAWLFS
jgi:hypothetical protein